MLPDNAALINSQTDVIINPANTSLLGGSGLDGQIHQAAGPQLLEECKTLNGARPGQTKFTWGYRVSLLV